MILHCSVAANGQAEVAADVNNVETFTDTAQVSMFVFLCLTLLSSRCVTMWHPANGTSAASTLLAEWVRTPQGSGWQEWAQMRVTDKIGGRFNETV